jgi:hypothetical protein
MELGPTIAEARKLEIIDVQQEEAIKSFKNTVRNPNLHYNIKKIIKRVAAKKVKKIDVNAQEVQELDISAEDNPLLWGFAEKFVDRETVFDVFIFAVKIVKELYEGKNMTFEEYFERLEKMQRWIITDLRRSSLDANANFLVAMGIFNYIEVLGSFFVPDTARGYATRRFNFAFQNLLPAPYQAIFTQLQALTTGAYDCLRCGLTHEYLIKTYTTRGGTVDINFTIYGVDDIGGYTNNVLTKNCGVELVQIGTNYHLRIYNPRLIHDLNLAFEEYKTRLLHNVLDYKTNFMQRCTDIHLEKFE